MGSEEKRERTWKGNCSSSKKPRNKKANLSIVSPLFKKLFHSMCFLVQTHLREVKQQRKCSCWLISSLIRTKNHDDKRSIMMRTLKKSLHTLIIRKNCTKPARRLSLSKIFPIPKARRFRNSVCSCSATLCVSAQILQDKRIMSQNWKLKSLFLMKSPHGELATRWGVW